MKKIFLEVCSFYSDKVASEWRRLYAENGELSYFSSYEFNMLFLKSYKNNKLRKNMKPFLIRVYNEDEPLMFLPLCRSGDEYYFMWDYSSVMYCEPVYKAGLSIQFFDILINKLPEILGNEVIFFTKMNDGLSFAKYLANQYTHYKRHTCMSMELPATFDKFYKNMTPEGRVAEEEARDRLKSSGYTFKTYFYSDKPITNKMFEKLYHIYYGNPEGWKARLKDRKYDKINPISCSLRKASDTVLAVSCINDEPVAFVGGFVRNGKITIVRCGEHKRYRDYEPRRLMYMDLIKYCIEKKNFTEIDFGTGKDRCKSEMGAKAHYTYYYEIKL